MLTGHDESTNQSQLQQGRALLKLGERVVNMDEDLESIGKPSIYSLGLVRLPHLATPAQFQFKHHSSNKFIQNTPQQLEKGAEHDEHNEHSSKDNMTPQNTSLNTLIPPPMFPTNPHPRIHHKNRRIHHKVINGGNSTWTPCASFKFLVGCRRVESSTTTLQDGPRKTRCLHVWSKRCEILVISK